MAMKMESRAELLSLLQTEVRPIDDVLAEFDSKFPRIHHFNHCVSLSLLLKDRGALQSNERLIAFAILYHCYSSQKPSGNPFISQMINAACNEETEKHERAFILCLLQLNGDNNNKEFLKQSALDYIKLFNPSAHEFLGLETLKQQFHSKADPGPSGCLFKDSSLKSLSPDPDVPCGSDADSPEMEPENSHELVRDRGTGADTSSGATVQNLLAKALEGSLPVTQVEQMLMELAKDPKLVYDCGITPRKLPQLVEQNPQIAVDVLTKLINSPEFADYFTALMGMEMSLHLMEVVNWLAASVELPKEFIHMYIASRISSFENIKIDLSDA